MGHLETVLTTSEINYEAEALQIIARAAEGGMRDALSITDQAIAFSDGTVTTQDALEVTGSLSYEMMDRLMQACGEKEVADALATLRELLASGKARRLLENLLVYCRDLLMYQQAPQLLSEKSLQLTEAFQTLAKIPRQQNLSLDHGLKRYANEVRFTNNPTIYLEVAVVKLANDPESAAVASNPADNSQEVAQLRQALQNFRQRCNDCRRIDRQVPLRKPLHQ